MKGPFGLLLIGGGIVLIVGLFSGKISFIPPDTSSEGAPVPAGIPSTKPGTGVNISGKTGSTSCPPGYSYDPGYRKCVPTVNAVNG